MSMKSFLKYNNNNNSINQTAREKVEEKRLNEQKENARQMRLLANSMTTRQFTYDFEGKIVIQNTPNLEKLPNTTFGVNFDV